jgi:hypothetical protein
LGLLQIVEGNVVVEDMARDHSHYLRIHKTMDEVDLCISIVT